LRNGAGLARLLEFGFFGAKQQPWRRKSCFLSVIACCALKLQEKRCHGT
jgi:hypothetical protein